MSGAGFVRNRREVVVIAAGGSLLALWPASGGTAAPVQDGAAPHTMRDQPFDDGWRFARGPGDGREATDFDDSAWRTVTLPHDWSMEDLPGRKDGPFDPAALGGPDVGFTVGGEGWYRKRFRLGDVPPGARVEILFDGISNQSDVFLNGHRVGGAVNGYMPFACDLTPQLDRDGDNVLAVRVRNVGRNSRWYAGSGIYRQVTLDVVPAAGRLARWGVAAWTKRIANATAEIDVSTTIDEAQPGSELVTRLRDGAGRVVAEQVATAAAEVRQTLLVGTPKLWSPASPTLYQLESEVRAGTKVLDRMVQPFGIRIVTFDPHRGMAINGSVTPLRGGCIHHDNGLLGACAFPDADERRVRLLRARGFNAIRSAHNIASRSLREACDRNGMLLIEEAFDAWHVGKKPDDFHTHFAGHWEEVVDAMVRSARNSPSVIMWSIGNEIPARAGDEGVKWEWMLANAVRRLDPTRPVTAGINWVLGQEMVAEAGTARPGHAGRTDNAATIFLDVPGYNYRLEYLEAEQRAHPERIVYASETFASDAHDYWALAARAPYFLGEFVWTAIDYLGEVGIGATVRLPRGASPPPLLEDYPWISGACGDLDLVGQQKAPSFARDVVWGVAPLAVLVHRPVPSGMVEHVNKWGWPDELASWTWRGYEGQALAVRIYTSAEQVEVRLNGAKVAERTLAPSDRMRTEVQLPYAPGRLEVLARRGGKVIGRSVLQTVGAAARLRLRPERAIGRKDRNALSYVWIDTLDAQGWILPDDTRTIRLGIDGPADLIGFGSGNPRATGSVQALRAQSFSGRALAILRSQGRAGQVRITADTDGLNGAVTSLTLG